MQWVCSLRDSLQGSRERSSLPRPTLRTGFPLPTRGRPQGHREAPLLICNFSRVAQATLQCKSRIGINLRLNRDFLRISTGLQSCKTKGLWKAGISVGKMPSCLNLGELVVPEAATLASGDELSKAGR